MQLVNLKGLVEISGADVLGRPSLVTLGPCPNDQHGWSWSTDGEGFWPVTVLSTQCNSSLRHLYLYRNGKKANILEHLLPLAFLGLRDIHMIAPKPWLPYLMPGEVWKILEPHLQFEDERIRWKTVENTVRHGYKKKRDGHEAFTEIRPHSKPTLVVDITISYPGLGERKRVYDLSRTSNDELVRIMSVGPQGWYWPIGILELLLRWRKWPHINKVVWPRFGSVELREQTLDKFLDHRFLDILGALALLGRGQFLPAVHVESVCSGHEADLFAVKMAKDGPVIS